MKFALVLATASVLAYLFCALLNSVGIPKALYVYVAWLFTTTSVAYFSLQRIPRDEKGYAIFYALTIGPAIALAIELTARFSLSLPHTWKTVVFIVALMFGCGGFVGVIAEHVKPSFARDIGLLEGYIFTFCGLVAFASLIPELPLMEVALRTTLAVYWFGVGTYAFVRTVGVSRNFNLFVSLNGWVPSALAIAAFGSLAMWLTFQQGEGARQEIRGMYVAQRYIEEGAQ